MLSYKHAFHAGNHADVFKHVCLLVLLNKLKQKAKPFSYIDTHAGAGLYDLSGLQARQTAEAEQGIKRLTHLCGQAELDDYTALVDEFVRLGYYPGSPAIAAHLSRAGDELHLCELHNNEIHTLKRNMRSLSAAGNLHCHHRNGFEALIALTPPKPGRGLVLIDPPYELAQEYQQTQNSLMKAVKRWPLGIYALWYPLLSKRAEQSGTHKAEMSEAMVNHLLKLPAHSMLDTRFWVQDPAMGGMYGSGVLLINPPWQTDNILEKSLSRLLPILSQSPRAGYSLTWLKQGE